MMMVISKILDKWAQRRLRHRSGGLIVLKHRLMTASMARMTVRTRGISLIIFIEKLKSKAESATSGYGTPRLHEPIGKDPGESISNPASEMMLRGLR